MVQKVLILNFCLAFDDLDTTDQLVIVFFVGLSVDASNGVV